MVISNISLNYTVNYTVIGTVNDISSLIYYPLLLLIVVIIPIIVLIITLSLNISNRTKIIILLFNLVYSLLLPFIAISIVTDFELKFYIYGAFLNYYQLTTNFFVLSTILIVLLYQNVGALTMIYIISNILMILYYWLPENLPEKYKYTEEYIKDIIIGSFEIFILSFITFTTISDFIIAIILCGVFSAVIIIEIIKKLKKLHSNTKK
jgi:hypothetical protein